MAEDNKTYLVKQWIKVIPALLFLVFVLFATAKSVISGVIPWEVILVVLFTIFVVVFAIWKTKSDVARFLRMETPDEWVAYNQKNMQQVPDADAWIAYSSGVAYAYFGWFEQADTLLHSIQWNPRVPLIAAAGLLLEALLEHLKNHNFYRGSGLTRQAYLMVEDAPRSAPGVKKALEGYQLWMIAGEVLCGRAKSETIQQIEQALPKMELMMRPFMAWALAVWYQRKGDSQASERWLNVAKSIAPHCRPLTELPPIPAEQ
jgi:hypothetical protein